jgi:putative DNA primase/helicase
MAQAKREGGGYRMIDFKQVKSDCTGKWPGIFSHLGVDVGTGKHRPCPVCGGKDRFRFDDKGGHGTWICNQCGAGDGAALVQKVLGIDYAGAMQQLAGIVGAVDILPAKRKTRKPGTDPRAMLQKVWSESTPMIGSDMATKYLRARGLVYAVQDVRFCPQCYESDNKASMPAMVAMIRNPQGKPVSLHRTYLDGPAKARIKSPKKLMTGTEKLSGCAIRLFPATDTVGVAEGIETAIAARQLFDVPVWATISSSIMEGFEPPQGIRRIIVFADNDANFTGQAAAFKLAKRLYGSDYVVEVRIPESVGDWADQIANKGTLDAPND